MLWIYFVWAILANDFISHLALYLIFLPDNIRRLECQECLYYNQTKLQQFICTPQVSLHAILWIYQTSCMIPLAVSHTVSQKKQVQIKIKLTCIAYNALLYFNIFIKRCQTTWHCIIHKAAPLYICLQEYIFSSPKQNNSMKTLANSPSKYKKRVEKISWDADILKNDPINRTDKYLILIQSST